jgi:hypothetical protein
MFLGVGAVPLIVALCLIGIVYMQMNQNISEFP